MTTTTHAANVSALDWPVYWFAALEKAIDAGDMVAAAEAQKQLERLGVTVRFRPRTRREESSDDNA